MKDEKAYGEALVYGLDELMFGGDCDGGSTCGVRQEALAVWKSI